MNYTAKEVAELLKDKPQQAHYIEFMIKKAIHHAPTPEHTIKAIKQDAVEEFCERFGDELTCDMTFEELNCVVEMHKQQLSKDS